MTLDLSTPKLQPAQCKLKNQNGKQSTYDHYSSAENEHDEEIGRTTAKQAVM
jgi:hypothetical protein